MYLGLKINSIQWMLQIWVSSYFLRQDDIAVEMYSLKFPRLLWIQPIKI